MGTFLFAAPPPDTRAYVTGVCSAGQACEMLNYCSRKDRKRRLAKPERLTRLATKAFCGCGAPLKNIRHLSSSLKRGKRI